MEKTTTKITRIHFPSVTVIEIDDGAEPRYYTSTRAGETYPSSDVMVTEDIWQKALAEAKDKGVRIEVERF